MKRLFILMMLFSMLCGTTVLANDDDYEKIKLKAKGEEIIFEIEEQKYEGNGKYEADPEIIMHFPERFDAKEDEKLYFRVKWRTKTAEEIDYDKDYYIKPKIFYVELPERGGEEETIRFRVNFGKREYAEDTTYSLWLVGGKDFEDNFLKGQEDIELKDDFVVFDVEEVQTTTEVFLTMGKELVQYNGEQKFLHEPLVFNEKGRMMIAAKDVPMIMEGRTADSILWNKVSRTVTVQTGEKIFSMSEGQQKWLYQGQEMQADTVPEIRNGIMYLPLREMAKVFDFDELTWDSSTQTVRLFRSSY